MRVCAPRPLVRSPGPGSLKTSIFPISTPPSSETAPLSSHFGTAPADLGPGFWVSSPPCLPNLACRPSTLSERSPDHRTTVKPGFTDLNHGETRVKPVRVVSPRVRHVRRGGRRSSTLMATTSAQGRFLACSEGTKTYVCVRRDAARGVRHAARSTNATERTVYIGRREDLRMSSARASAGRTSATRPECTCTTT